MSEWFKEWSATEQEHQLLLFCFPCAGAGASMFVPMAAHLDPTIKPIGVQLPGREERVNDPFIDDLDTVVECLYLAIQRHVGMPMAFFGYSHGVLLAFELAKLLAGQSQPVQHFFIAAKKPPHLRECNPPLHQMDGSKMIEQLQTLGYLPAAISSNEQVMRMLLPRFRSDLRLCETFQTEFDEKLAVPHTCLVGHSDHIASYDDMLRWQDLITGSQQRHVFDGGHMFYNDHHMSLSNTINQSLKVPSCGSIA